MSLPFPSDSRGSSAGREEALSVSELVELLNETLEERFAEVRVVGELASFKRHHLSGHCYLSLTDGDSTLDAVMWKGQAGRLAFEPAAGDEVICRGRIGVYQKQGRMQLYVSSMRPVGAGAAGRALEALRKKLEAEGLFDSARKRPLPVFPGTVGVVTSKSGAAIDDILTTIRRRFPDCHVVLSPAAVQGERAASELIAALELLAADGRADVVVIGRGGGAAEDLAAFNDEALVRAVAAHPVPVVSAVGHEMDFTLCDLAADHRAATPTAAGEAVVPVFAELCEAVVTLDTRLGRSARRGVESLRHRVGDARGRLKHPAALVSRARQRTDEIAMRLERALIALHRIGAERVAAAAGHLSVVAAGRMRSLRERLDGADERLRAALRETSYRTSSRLGEAVTRLEALSPLSVLERGYSLASRADGTLVRSVGDVRDGEELTLRFHRGRAGARVLWREQAEDEP